MTKPKKPPRVKRKFVLIEVETDMSNRDLARHSLCIDALTPAGRCRVLQVHANTAKEVSRG